MGANHAESTLGILQGGGGLGERPGVGDTIFDQNAVDVDGDEPVADFGALKIDGENVVGAAGEDDDGCVGAWAE